MKMIKKLMMVIIVGLVPLHAHALNSGPEGKIVTDAELAAIHGGFCIFETCEPYPGSGVCEPVIPEAPIVCGATNCYLITIGNITACITSGPVTCTEINTYQQCIIALKLSYCDYGSLPLCGEKEQGNCYPLERECVCRYEPAGLCDWTSCIP